MLKIYLCNIEYELHNNGRIINLSTDSQYAIIDEESAIPRTVEFGAYTEDAVNAYSHSCELQKTRKGIKAFYWTWDCPVYAKEWVAPDAKLVVNISYKEEPCSMKRLMELPATDVIAYFKQEGLNLLIPS